MRIAKVVRVVAVTIARMSLEPGSGLGLELGVIDKARSSSVSTRP